MAMKVAAMLAALAALTAAPIACVLLACPAVQTHDCCPKSKSFSACPYDILSSAKAALPAVMTAAIVRITIQPAPVRQFGVRTVVVDERGLHLLNRVLRI